MHENIFGFSRGVWVREHCTLQIAKAAAAEAANQKQLQKDAKASRKDKSVGCHQNKSAGD
jgi:hypothetical protein